MEQKDDVEPLAVDTPTAMRMLSLGRSSVLGLADRGELPRLHFGRRVVYAVADVEAVIERRRAAARAGDVFRIMPSGPAELAPQSGAGPAGVVKALAGL